jgi:hypothetical protein
MANNFDDLFGAQAAQDKNRPDDEGTVRPDDPAAKDAEPEEEESKNVPSMYPDHDPEFDRPIFRRRQDTPPAPPSGSIIRKTNNPARPANVRPSIPRREDMTANLAPLPLKKVETGVNSLDIRTGGLAVGTLNILSGADSISRSHLAVYIAHHIVSDGGRVLALISPNEEGHWNAETNLFVDVAVRRTLDSIVETIEEAGKLDLIILDPIHCIETPSGQDRVASMDQAVARLLAQVRRKRSTLFSIGHLVDRASRHEGVSLHPWMFQEISCLMDLSDLILILRTHRSGQREILTYRRTINNRIGGLPSFVLPWV